MTAVHTYLWLAVAAGGALGALARYWLASTLALWVGGGFPWPILAVNALGSFMMGLLVDFFALKGSFSLEMRAFLTVGLLGGFTTFSSFALDAALLIERGQLLTAFLYIALSVGLALGGLILGRALIQGWLA